VRLVLNTIRWSHRAPSSASSASWRRNDLGFAFRAAPRLPLVRHPSSSHANQTRQRKGRGRAVDGRIRVDRDLGCERGPAPYRRSFPARSHRPDQLVDVIVPSLSASPASHSVTSRVPGRCFTSGPVRRRSRSPSPSAVAAGKPAGGAGRGVTRMHRSSSWSNPPRA